jgi:hypothetical protein
VYYREKKSQRHGKRWSLYVIQALLELTHSLWIYRNSVLHERDSQGSLLNEGADLTATVEAMYHTPEQQLLTGDRYLLTDRTLAQLQRLQPPEKETWLYSMSLAKEIAAEE